MAPFDSIASFFVEAASVIFDIALKLMLALERISHCCCAW
jgi:hypothetical protein